MYHGPKCGILFVCMANICRSPMAQGLLQHRIDEAGLTGLIAVDSAGTHPYRAGEPPDPRAQNLLRARGIDISGLRARVVLPVDFLKFDFLVAMDRHNFDELRFMSGVEHHGKLSLMLSHAPGVKRRDVPDPYGGPEERFQEVVELLAQAVDGLFAVLRQRYLA